MNVRNIAGGYLLALGVLVSFDYLIVSYGPLRWWFDYRDVTFQKIGETGIKFNSYRTIRTEIPALVFNDTLYCKTNGGDFANYSFQTTVVSNALPINNLETPQTWLYDEPIPPPPALCYLRSVTTGVFRYGIRRSDDPIITETFKIE
jgi:hypothetical protein